MNKIILVNKEKNYTSRDVVNILTKIFKTKKIGHFGTLDPLAQGLLVIGIGKYTKLVNLIENDDKEYIAEVLVGTKTDTYDITGNVILEKEIKNINKDKLQIVINSFQKTYMQEVPIYSAVKKSGKKLYEYARENKEVELPKKEVTIKNIKLLDIYEKDNKIYFKFKTLVTKGTYIRSLINDISKEFNIPMTMSELIRTKQANFSISDASTLKDIENNNYKSYKINDLINVEEKEIPKELEKQILNGAPIEKLSNKYILFKQNEKEIVLYGPYENKMKPILNLREE